MLRPRRYHHRSRHHTCCPGRRWQHSRRPSITSPLGHYRIHRLYVFFFCSSLNPFRYKPTSPQLPIQNRPNTRANLKLVSALIVGTLPAFKALFTQRASSGASPNSPWPIYSRSRSRPTHSNSVSLQFLTTATGGKAHGKKDIFRSDSQEGIVTHGNGKEGMMDDRDSIMVKKDFVS